MTPPLLVKATQVENNTKRPKNGYAEKGKRDIKVSMMGEHMVDIYDKLKFPNLEKEWSVFVKSSSKRSLMACTTNSRRSCNTGHSLSSPDSMSAGAERGWTCSRLKTSSSRRTKPTSSATTRL